jgi:hypothetical protein
MSFCLFPFFPIDFHSIENHFDMCHSAEYHSVAGILFNVSLHGILLIGILFNVSLHGILLIGILFNVSLHGILLIGIL